MTNKMQKILLLWNTIKYLKPIQILYRVKYYIRNNFSSKLLSSKILYPRQGSIIWSNLLENSQSYTAKNNFSFLNQRHEFEDNIDWNYSQYGKLWTYNLNYFDFLNQTDISASNGISLIKDYIEKNDRLKDGLEPYPISLRGINWIKFLGRTKTEDKQINAVLFQHYSILTKNLEYHLLANHLLENGFSLYFGAYYFNDREFYKLAKGILIKELREQVLDDGAHFELSPMYHQIILYRLLDCINLSRLNKWDEDDLLPFLIEKGIKMLEWLETVTYFNGNIPMVNDSTYGIAPSSKQLSSYAKLLGLQWDRSKLSDSGYRKFSNNKYELFIDVGNIGPAYQPGHAHSDTFNFELYVNKNPVIVDAGISTYEKNDLRQLQRSTVSHNTVKIGNNDQSQVWGGFRVGNRARIISIKESDNFLEASHDGYKALGLIHARSFKAKIDSIIIKDRISKSSPIKQTAYLHFHPDITSVDITENELRLEDQQMSIKVDNALTINKDQYEYALGFNLTKTALVVEIQFDKELKVEIDLM